MIRQRQQASQEIRRTCPSCSIGFWEHRFPELYRQLNAYGFCRPPDGKFPGRGGMQFSYFMHLEQRGAAGVKDNGAVG